MIQLEGYLRDLSHQRQEPVRYALATHLGEFPLNDWLGHSLSIVFTGQKACIACGRKVKKLYQNGYCFPCVTRLAECDLCIVKPHECHFHLGTCRDEAFAQQHCFIPHYVYLAFSSHVKVGLTRKGRHFTRWIDQGATSAILFAEVPSRKDAGELEMEIAQILPDKTDWRKMLAAEVESADLIAVKQQVMEQLRETSRFVRYWLSDENTVYRFHYPRLADVPVSLKSLSLDKSDRLEGRLLGVKGQYLLFETGVFNVKKHAGYQVHVSAS